MVKWVSMAFPSRKPLMTYDNRMQYSSKSKASVMYAALSKIYPITLSHMKSRFNSTLNSIKSNNQSHGLVTYIHFLKFLQKIYRWGCSFHKVFQLAYLRNFIKYSQECISHDKNCILLWAIVLFTLYYLLKYIRKIFQSIVN